MPSRSHFCSHPFLLHMAGVAAVQPLPLLCAICRTAENHPINWAEGRALHAAEPTVIVSGKKAVAAMTCPGVPTHKKRLRPAERVETESATYAECSSRSGSGGPLRRGRVAAQCRLSAPNAEGKQKRHCAIKLNANGRLDNLLSAICRSSPLEAGGGTRCMAPQAKSRRAFLVRCAKAAR